MARKSSHRGKHKIRTDTSKRKSQEEPPIGAKVRAYFFAHRVWKIWSYFWGILGPILTLFAIYVNYYPSIHVSPGQQLSASDPFSVPFLITNPNKYRLTNVRVVFEMPYLLASIKNGGPNEFLNCSIRTVPTIPSVNSQSSVACFFQLDHIFKNISLMQKGTIEAVITYDPPWFYGSNREYKQRYNLYIADDRSIYWIATGQ